VIPSKKSNQLIVFGGGEDPAYENQFKKYYTFDCNTNQANLVGELKENVKFDFDFDNTAASQTMVRSLKGSRQELVVLRFLDDGTYEFKKKDVA